LGLHLVGDTSEVGKKWKIEKMPMRALVLI
jgi:hypothetical protein